MTTGRLSPSALLTEGVRSLAGLLSADDTLYDPVFDCPTQYGSAYYGWCCAVLGGRSADSGLDYSEQAGRLLRAAVAHSSDPVREPWASGFDRQTLSVTGRLNHRDFTWPPILKTYQALGWDDASLGARIAAVDVAASFRARPPSNWAAVWMSGEWLRMQAGLSSTSLEEFDDWIDVFFAGGPVGFDLDLGMYLEPGLPNSYDLFTRAHFTDLLAHGYDGRNRERLEAFLTTGLRRSLATQLSDGSVASGYRSAGQTWVLGAQIALFIQSRSLGLGTDEEQEAARSAAWRAFDSLARWQRPGGVFSPVQNLLEPAMRVGYERYTSDGHYSPLALGFLASAIDAGFGDDTPPSDSELDARPVQTLTEGEPSHRGVVHRGRVSLAVQAQADDTYDATGLVDLTFGVGRLLHFVSAARHLSGGPWLVPGLALRERSGASPVTAVGGRQHAVTELTGADGGLHFTSVLSPTDDATSMTYHFEATVTESGVEVAESTPGRSGHVSLLVPYLRDLGSGLQTQTSFSDSGVRFTLGDESVAVTVEGEVERVSDLPYGYESRRGICGLVRIDLREPAEVLRWWTVSSPS